MPIHASIICPNLPGARQNKRKRKALEMLDFQGFCRHVTIDSITQSRYENNQSTKNRKDIN
jgi:hypothetical protein